MLTTPTGQQLGWALGASPMRGLPWAGLNGERGGSRSHNVPLTGV